MIKLFIIIGIVTMFYILLFALGTWVKNDSVVIVFYPISFLIVALTSFSLNFEESWVKFTILLMIGIWSIRLTWHLLTRNKKIKENINIIKRKEKFSIKFYGIQRFLFFYLFQELYMLLISSPYIYILLFTNKLNFNNVFYYSGVALWIIGLIIEIVSDNQISTFINKKVNKNKVFKGGLWKYSRHPNYFGEITLWWGIFMVSLITQNYWLIISPLVLTIGIRFVSGINKNEAKFKNNTEYKKYKKHTNALVLWFTH